MEADIGLIGLAALGRNLALNLSDHGYSVTVYNRPKSVAEAFLAGEARGREIGAAGSLEELAFQLARPRKVLVLVKAGQPVDEMIDRLTPFLEPGDLILDGANSHYEDSCRRARSLAEQGFRFIGLGIAGGDEAARRGPSLMPGGDPGGWALARELLGSIAAKTASGESCCAYVGPEGAGHFAKAIHNGLEYGDMQIIAEGYLVMRDGFGMSHAEMSAAFGEWNRGELGSYLLEISAEILAAKDADGSPLVERILDAAAHKGTGRWASEAALEAGSPLSIITEAVFARSLSALAEERSEAAEYLEGPRAEPLDRAGLADLRDAMMAAKILSYAQAFSLMTSVGAERGWELDLGELALVWREGCIIRSPFLERIKEAFDEDGELVSLMLAPRFTEALASCQGGLRRTVAAAALAGLPAPALSSALAYYDGYRCARLPANLIQAQRDFFGAHGFERVDGPRGAAHHGAWKG